MDIVAASKFISRYGWFEWISHTNFSFLAGASHPSEYLERALALGYHGMAVTDFDGVYGLARAHLDLRRLRRTAALTDFRLAYGAELHLAPDHHLPIVYRNTIVLVAQTLKGYGHMCRLLTRAHRHGKSGAYLSLEDLLTSSLEDVVAIQPMRGVIRSLGSAKDVAQEHGVLWQRYGALAEAFSGRFYLAVSRHLSPAEDVWIAPTLELSRRLALPCLLSQDAFFHEPQRKEMSDLLHAIRVNKTLNQAVSQMFINTERSFHSLQGLAGRFAELDIFPRALESSAELAESCGFDLDALRYHYPKEMIPEGYHPQSFLESLVWQAARARYGHPVPGRIGSLLVHELKLIETLNFADYFLTVWDIVSWARGCGILCQGRGSAANSAVCFVLGITAVDPMLFDLLFERFVSVERGDPPDIDVDFEHERREEVIQYIYSRYGRDKASMVANVITFRTKGAMRAVGRALGISEGVLGDVGRQLESHFVRSTGAQKAVAVAKIDNQDSSIPWKLWSSLAQRLKGFPRHLGIHSGGFMLADQPLDHLVAQEPATMEGRTVIQWSKDDIEGLGFFKIDILALGMLSAIRKSLKTIEDYYGRPLTLDQVPQEDPATYAMIQRADTVGTFQIESRAQMSMLPRLRPRTFYDLVIEVAIIRPGPIQGGMIHPYLRRRDGLEPVAFPDERLRTILARTLGIPLFQEQVMRIAMTVGGFTPGEANELRRHMGAWSLKGDMGPWLTRLAEGMRREGLKEEFVESILGQMRGFADYGFPESHAVSFAFLAYASAWIKCHYPAAFFLALLNSQPMGFYSPHSLVQAAQRQGVKVLPVSVQSSLWESCLELVDGSGEHAVYAVRLGFHMVHSLRREAVDLLLVHRSCIGGRFEALESFLQTVPLQRRDFTALAAAGALGDFGLERRAALWVAEAAPFCPTLEDLEDPAVFADESSMEAIQQDFAATGTTLGPHPATVVLHEFWCYDVPLSRLVPGARLLEEAPNQMVHVFGMVLVRQAPPSAHGMVFLTLEDETGFINLVFTPQIYKQYHDLVESQSFLCVKGRLQRQGSSHSLLVVQLFAPKIRRADVIPMQSCATDQLPKTPSSASVVSRQITPEGDQTTASKLTQTRNYH